MKNKNQKKRIRAIKRTNDYFCSSLPFPVPSIGLFPAQERLKGRRLFAVYLDCEHFMLAFDLLSSAKRFKRDISKQYPLGRFDIVLLEVK